MFKPYLSEWLVRKTLDHGWLFLLVAALAVFTLVWAFGT